MSSRALDRRRRSVVVRLTVAQYKAIEMHARALNGAIDADRLRQLPGARKRPHTVPTLVANMLADAILTLRDSEDA